MLGDGGPFNERVALHVGSVIHFRNALRGHTGKE